MSYLPLDIFNVILDSHSNRFRCLEIINFLVRKLLVEFSVIFKIGNSFFQKELAIFAVIMLEVTRFATKEVVTIGFQGMRLKLQNKPEVSVTKCKSQKEKYLQAQIYFVKLFPSKNHNLFFQLT